VLLFALLSTAIAAEVTFGTGLSLVDTGNASTEGPAASLDVFPVPAFSVGVQGSWNPVRQGMPDSERNTPGVYVPKIYTDGIIAARLGAHPLFIDKPVGWLRMGLQANYGNITTLSASPPASTGFVVVEGNAPRRTYGGGASLELGKARSGVRLDADWHRTMIDYRPSVDFEKVITGTQLGSQADPFPIDALALTLRLQLYLAHKHASMSTKTSEKIQAKKDTRQAKEQERIDEEQRLVDEEKARLAAVKAEQDRIKVEESAEAYRLFQEKEAAEARAAAPSKPLVLVESGRVAVLELGGVLATEEKAVLTDHIRGSVVDNVGADVQVMTKENMEVMLTDMGLDASCISEGACEVETARNLGVDYVISGTVAKMGDTFIVTIKLHNVRNAQLLGTASAQGVDPLTLLNAMPDTTADLMTP